MVLSKHKLFYNILSAKTYVNEETLHETSYLQNGQLFV